eukprot:12610345-Heterocapsa_arctica.AAC.1
MSSMTRNSSGVGARACAIGCHAGNVIGDAPLFAIRKMVGESLASRGPSAITRPPNPSSFSGSTHRTLLS